MEEKLLREIIRNEIKHIVMKENSGLSTYFGALMQGIRGIIDAQIEKKKAESMEDFRNRPAFKNYVKQMKLDEKQAEALFQKISRDIRRG